MYRSIFLFNLLGRPGVKYDFCVAAQPREHFFMKYRGSRAQDVWTPRVMLEFLKINTNFLLLKLIKDLKEAFADDRLVGFIFLSYNAFRPYSTFI